METYRQTIEALQPKKNYKLFISIGLVYLLNGAVNFYKDFDENFWQGTIWLFTGIGFIINFFLQKDRDKKLYIEINKNTIEAKLSHFTSLSISWNDVISINIKPISIYFELPSNKKEEISLGSLSYKGVLELKEKLHEFAVEKGIKLT